jgi:hypothetical protein
LNTGTSNTAVTGCSLQISGIATASTPTTVPTITAGAAATPVICEVSGNGAGNTVGAAATGSFTMANGAIVSFSGLWAT